MIQAVSVSGLQSCPLPYGYMSELLTWFGRRVEVECSEPAVSLAADAVSGLPGIKDICTKTWFRWCRWGMTATVR